MKRKDPNAVALGKKGKDKPKTMTPAALAQRLRNAREISQRRTLRNCTRSGAAD